MLNKLRKIVNDRDYKTEVRIVICLLGSLVVTLVIQSISQFSIRHLMTADTSVLENYELETNLESLDRRLITLESNVRSYIISGNRSFIPLIGANIVDARGRIDRIQELTAENGAPPPEIQQLRQFTEGKIIFSESVIDTFHVHGEERAEAFVNTGRGLELRDSILNITRRLRQLKQERIVQTIYASHDQASRIERIDLISTILAIGIVGLSIFYFVVSAQRRHRLRRHLEEARVAAEQSAELKEQFMANMSHEIRTPINAILGFSTLMDRTQLAPRQREFMTGIRHSSENLLQLVNDILDFSKIEAGMLGLERIPFSVSEVLHALKNMLAYKAEAKGLLFELRLPEQPVDVLIGDPTRLMQILTNLTSNAIKFTPGGSVTVATRLLPHPDGRWWLEVRVTDTGIGIPAAHQALIFDRFQQGTPDTTRRFGGTGLGLSIVRSLVDAQQGRLELTSQEGHGSTFTVRIPYQAAVATAVSAPSVPSLAALPPGRVLVVEDNAFNRRILELELDNLGLSCVTAETGSSALRKLAEESFDLVLMDIQMPDMNGYTTTRHIRRQFGPDLPVIALTAHAMPGEREKCLESGMNDYLTKPLKPEQLLALLRRYLPAACVEGSEPPMSIDWAYVYRIAGGKETRILEMTGLFKEQIEQELTQLKAALEQTDHSTAVSIAHTMRSTVAYMGLQQSLGEPLAQLEQAARDGAPVTALAAQTDHIHRLIVRAKVALDLAPDLI